MAARARGIRVRPLSAGERDAGAPERSSAEKTLRAVICDELKQFSGVTSSTSSGSANVMSTHCEVVSYVSPAQDGGGMG